MQIVKRIGLALLFIVFLSILCFTVIYKNRMVSADEWTYEDCVEEDKESEGWYLNDVTYPYSGETDDLTVSMCFPNFDYHTPIEVYLAYGNGELVTVNDRKLDCMFYYYDGTIYTSTINHPCPEELKGSAIPNPYIYVESYDAIDFKLVFDLNFSPEVVLQDMYVVVELFHDDGSLCHWKSEAISLKDHYVAQLQEIYKDKTVTKTEETTKNVCEKMLNFSDIPYVETFISEGNTWHYNRFYAFPEVTRIKYSSSNHYKLKTLSGYVIPVPKNDLDKDSHVTKILDVSSGCELMTYTEVGKLVPKPSFFESLWYGQNYLYSPSAQDCYYFYVNDLNEKAGNTQFVYMSEMLDVSDPSVVTINIQYRKANPLLSTEDKITKTMLTSLDEVNAIGDVEILTYLDVLDRSSMNYDFGGYRFTFKGFKKEKVSEYEYNFVAQYERTKLDSSKILNGTTVALVSALAVGAVLITLLTRRKK